MPQTIVRPIDNPLIAVSQWPQHSSYSAVDHFDDVPYHCLDWMISDLPIGTPSNSFQSTTLSGPLWSETQGFLHLGSPGENSGSLNTAPSSFDVTTNRSSKPISFSSPLVANPASPLHLREKVNDTASMHGADPSFGKRSLTTSTHFPDTNVSTLSHWAQGTYNVSDRTNFGELAGPGAPLPGLRRRGVALSHAGSSTSVACNCGKVFASKSDKE